MLNFSKMHGLGNDFIIFTEEEDLQQDYTLLAQKICNRNIGIGADGILVALPSQHADIKMRIINSDGSEANMCGNGVRCFARYVFEQGIVAKEEFAIETLAGIMKPKLTMVDGKVSSVTINMGKPVFEREAIPMNGPKGNVVAEKLAVNDEFYNITSMLMGVPHTIIFVENVDHVDIRKIGPRIEQHIEFPQKTNVNFVQVINERELKVRTWERGAGLTYACGTGSCAAVVAAWLNRLTSRTVTVHLELGNLMINYTEEGVVYMTGPAENICFGEYKN